MGFNFAKTFEESRKIYESVLQDDNIGIPIRINKNNKNLSKTLAKDFEQTAIRVQNQILQYCLQATFSIATLISQGDYVEIFDLGTKITSNSVPIKQGVVYSTITADPVSKICSILVFNATAIRYRDKENYNQYGEVISVTPNTKTGIPIYLEKATYRKVDYGVGQAREITATLYAHKDEDIQWQDVIEYGDQRYRVDNIDDIRKNNLIIADLSNFME